MKKYMQISLMSAILAISFSADALWITNPTNPTDVANKSWFINTKYKATGRTVTPYFYDSISNLAFVYLIKTSTREVTNIKIHSNQTDIGNSYIATVGFNYKLMCPDGHTTKVVTNIATSKNIWFPNSYRTSDVYPGQPCSYVPPANKTSVATVQTMYGVNYTVTRLYSTKDIFKVECTVSPACDVYDGVGGYSNPHQAFYLSNTQRIGYKFPRLDMAETYARTTDTLTDPVAQADVNYLAENYFGGYVVWVNYYSNPVYTSWFN